MRLELVLLIEALVVLFGGYIYLNIRGSFLSIKQALIWFLLAVLVGLAALNVPVLEKIADLIGIKTASNMMFFFGILFALLLAFLQARVLTGQQKKVTRLTQESALLQEKIVVLEARINNIDKL